MSSPRWTRWIPLWTAALVVAPVVLDLLLSDRRRPFGYLAPDTFYYLTVARNISERRISSFDGQRLTNGYHPLWQWITAALYWLNARITGHEPLLLSAIVVICAALVGLGVWLFARALTRTAGPTPGLLLLPVGVVGLMVAPMWLYLGAEGVLEQSEITGGRPLWGTAFSFVNGMESGLVLCCFGLLAWRYADGRALASRRAAVVFGALLAGLTLARLDHLFIAAPIALGVALEDRGAVASRSRVRLMAAAFALPVLAYMLMNGVVFGSIVPVSGAAKSSLPYLSNDAIARIVNLLGPEPSAKWLPVAGRLGLLLLPILFAALWLSLWLRARLSATGLTITVRPGWGAFDRFLSYTALGVLVLGLYNFLFVGLYHQGPWYFPA